ncbi:SulP family inorganic anion transporter [Aurantibacillus circumpalustris]|uniref:SulP family inorganic anion transporter n=1 Tax=Aurantibacillus circumpalustris TaxID=3036359 RepID=UPI00295A7ABC|nr:SulP family inorganic anion transporter [Aurantibacillus circumpalustris]
MTHLKLIGSLKTIPNNLFAGFVVSLVALPLGLGLAVASGAPPIAGVISAIVGGIIVSILGGSNVTITGPGNSLVVALLGAITVLGNGNMYEGYLFVLAAIIASGVLITVLSFLKIGYIGNFFSASALQGMLSAIGLIIMSKQAHIMLGNMRISGDPIHLLAKFPQSIYELIHNDDLWAPATAGIISLLIMVTYSNIRNKYFQLIPAPMWIVIISVGFAYYIQAHPDLKHPLDSEFLLSIPDNALSKFPTPDFSKCFDYYFILAVISITLIASIESILSIKAVDKLDPKKRRSNTDKELRALGIASIVSGFLGGLNVVTVIARSSVNVNNGGTNRFSNFFQAIFLLLFILLFQEQLKHIPYPALAAILVYTGYKLISPQVFRRIYKIGKKQFFIFIITLISTLYTSLISGILIGSLTTFIVHTVYAKSITLFMRYLFTNNVQIQELQGKRTLITVKYYCTFLNFFRLKNAIDRLPEANEIIIDFKQCKFVDHTALESLNAYESNFNVNEAYFKIIGLNTKRSATEHPFTLRQALQYVLFVDLDARSNKRKRLLRDFVNELHWEYTEEPDYNISFLNNFQYFSTRQASYTFNNCYNDSIRLFDLEYSEGAFIAKEDLHSTFIYIQVPPTLPAFTLEKRDLFEKLSFLGYKQEIKFKEYHDFTHRFLLKGKNKRKIHKYFNEELVLFLECNKPYHIESDGNGGIIVMNKEHTATIAEVKAMTDFCIRLYQLILNTAFTDQQ